MAIHISVLKYQLLLIILEHALIHHSTIHNSMGNHYAVGLSSTENVILLQVQENGNQARIALTEQETKHMIALLEKLLPKVKNAE